MNDFKSLIKVILFLITMFLGLKLMFFLLGYFNLISGIIFKHLTENWFIYLSVIFSVFLILSFSAIILNSSKQKKISTLKHIRIEIAELFQSIIKTIIGASFTILFLALFFIVLGYLAKLIYGVFSI
ncbi:hypothetical protein [Flavobacterium psychrophilum]|uniref:hypothetical protein n=1 Tax=Flavobacterium psychrophilum TaxID=96345 RepID=UPI00106AE65B|nr:hypothetical protein [Flavobacterium psychrophilum]